MSNEQRGCEFDKPRAVIESQTKVPKASMLAEYIQAAMRHAAYKRYDDGTIYGSIEAPGFEGVWANEETREQTERELRSTLED